jgi:LysR family glycine cleavage system transcriptional activator
MSRYLPPLNSLRAYECAARHMSFTLASRELNVTPAAVSHQVKVLEKHLGLPLFTRLTRQLVLTEAGENMLGEVSEALDKISGAVGSVKHTVMNERLTLRLGPSLAARWLSPRLHLFWQQFPHIDLCLLHSNSPVNFDREDIDLAITYGKGDWSGVVVSRLLDSDFFPVCSPGLLDTHARVTQASCLEELTLLHDASYEGWESWLRLAGVADVNPHRGPIIDDTNVLIQAALNGQGIALGSTLLVQEYLDAGQLVRPFETEMKSDNAYYIVCPRGHLRRPAVQEFKNWLLQYRVVS